MIELGYIAKAHGLNGELRAKFDVHDIEEHANREEIYLKKGRKKAALYSIESMHFVATSEVILTLAGIEGREAAEKLVGYTMYMPESELPELEEGRFYYHEIKGFTVEDQQLGKLGMVLRVMEMPLQDVVVMFYKGKEVLIPMTDDFVLHADKNKRLLHTNLPEGLIELYLNG